MPGRPENRLELHVLRPRADGRGHVPAAAHRRPAVARVEALEGARSLLESIRRGLNHQKRLILFPIQMGKCPRLTRAMES